MQNSDKDFDKTSEEMPKSWEREEQYQANNGSHNQAIDYDSLSTSTLMSLIDWRRDPITGKNELECLLSNSMQQEADCASSEHMLLSGKSLNSENQINTTGIRVLELQFLKSIYQPVFTGVPIKGEDGWPLMVALIDCQSGQVVTLGPEASARVEIVGLAADFGVCLGDSWTSEEFKSKIIRKEGTKHLITGDVYLKLEGGYGCTGTFQFAHTRIWKRKCAYRLGAIVIDDDIGTRIKEGLTNSFIVKDRRQNLDNKHYPPTPSSEVWRLDGIAKNGPFHLRLRDINVNTVEDILKILNTDPQKLQNVLGKTMPARTWKALVMHARTCI